MNLQIFTDGGAKGNPGPSAIGVFIKSNNSILLKYREDIGVATNNVAEYTAVIRALEIIAGQEDRASQYRLPTLEVDRIDKIEFFADSLLVVEQLKRKWKIRQAHLQTLAEKVWQQLDKLALPYSFTHIPREKNQVADDLVNGAR